jgi:ABC-type lipoprotein export system ATPase subunit
MIRAQGVVKSYAKDPTTAPVLRGIDLAIGEGGFTCIVGRSGSGKSTLLNILSSLLRPDQGTVHYRDRSLTGMSESEINLLRSTEFGMIFQMHHLLPFLTAMENVMLPFMKGLRPVSGAQRARAEECLGLVGLPDKLHRLPGELSGGEQQRVAVARALAVSPKVVFADEPTGSLDKATGEGVVELLKRINKAGITVVMVTHEQEYARSADQVITLEDGKVIDGPGQVRPSVASSR